MASGSGLIDGKRKARILFVDDEESILTTMRIMFRRHCDVLTANSGEEALEVLRQTDVDVIVSDQRMPGMTGVEVLRASRDLRPRAMRILLTGYSDLTAIMGSINDGEIFRFVQKPWSNDELIKMVSDAFDAAQNVSAEHSAQLVESGEHAAPQTARTGLLILDTDIITADEVKRMLSPIYQVHHATSIADALDLLDKYPIGVLLVETTVGGESVVSLLSLLKQHHPQVVSIVLTHRSDANAAVDLINKGQIFRFLLKPARQGMTTRSVNQAMERHQNLTQNPNLSRRYKVETPVQPAAEAPVNDHAAGGLLQRIKQLRGVISGKS